MKKVSKQKVKKDEGIEAGAAILGIGVILAGAFLWLRSRRAKQDEALASMQLRESMQLESARSPARKLQKQEVTQTWQPEFSSHWRGG